MGLEYYLEDYLGTALSMTVRITKYNDYLATRLCQIKKIKRYGSLWNSSGISTTTLT